MMKIWKNIKQIDETKNTIFFKWDFREWKFKLDMRKSFFSRVETWWKQKKI